ncbi:MAG: hypothetical protein K8R88_13105, partial [Armatimonadetes bacterium]|nr:hypothetical protein [Armatimonadota bacterium]
MKRVLTTSIALSALSAAFAAPFTPGNLVVTQIGDGAAALTAFATPVFLVEMTPAGAIVQTIPMPTTGASQFTCRGTSTSEVHLNVNDNKFTFAGYDAAVGAADPSIASNLSTDATPMRRVIAVVDMNGNIDTTTRMVDTNSGGSVRSAVINGTDLWISGTNGNGAANFLTSGIRYATVGASFSTGITDTATGNLTNMRNVGIFGGQLYIGSFSGTTYNGINAVGTGLPTSGVQPLVNKVNTAAGGSPASTGCYDFIFTGNALYAASDQSTTLGGLVKWTTADGGATWNFQYIINNIATGGIRSLALSGSTFYVTGANGTVYSGQDLGVGSTFTAVAAAPTNTTYRGIKVVPAATGGGTISGSVDLNGYVGTAPGSATLNLEFSILDATTSAVLQGPTSVTVTPSGGSA